MTLGERLTALRKEKGMSQDALAGILGVSRQSVSKWETDASIPDLDNLVRLSDLFEVTLDELVRGKKPERPAEKVALPETLRQLGRMAEKFWREKAYLAGWLLILWGGKRGFAFLKGVQNFYRNTNDMEKTVAFFKSALLPSVLPVLLILFASGLLLLTLGRKKSGSFEWYHLGWWGIFAAAIGIRGKSFLNTGLLEELLLGVWMTLRYGSPWEIFGVVGEAICSPRFVLLAACIAMLLLGKRQKNKSAE